MGKYNAKGMIIYPCSKKEEVVHTHDYLVVEDCYCPNGHNLICNQIYFNSFKGLKLQVHTDKKTGIVFLSPIYGEKCRASMDIDLEFNHIYDLSCPECGVRLPAFGPCTCGGELVTLFLDEKLSFSNCIAVCNKFGCPHSEIKSVEQLRNFYMTDSF